MQWQVNQVELGPHQSVWLVTDRDRWREYMVQRWVRSSHWAIKSMGNGQTVPSDGKRGKQIIAAVVAAGGLKE